jgi:predicted cupin superfamily sugar epimerase
MSLDLRDPGLDGASVIAALGLRPHPEGGHYREVWRDAPEGGGPLVLSLSSDGRRVERELRLGPDLGAAEALIGVVPKGWWQAARPAGGRWCLVSCTVSPAFDFAGFELAPPGWEPGT